MVGIPTTLIRWLWLTWLRVRVSRLFNATISTALAAEVVCLLVWVAPYEFAVKRWLIRHVTKSNFMTLLLEKWTPIITLVSGFSLATEGALYMKGTRLLSPITAKIHQKRAAAVHRAYRTFFTLIMGMFVSRAMFLVKDNLPGLIALEQMARKRDMLAFRPSTTLLNLVTAPFRRVFSPVFTGLNNIPTPLREGGTAPLLFVSNHTILGFEMPLLLHGLYQKKGIYLRALADHSHFQVPVNAEILRSVLGAVDGTHDNAEALLLAGENVFVYPGGARETFKRTTDERYILHWQTNGKKHTGFVKLALKTGATIVPVVNVGTEDMFWPIADLPLGWVPVPFIWGSRRTLPVLTSGSLERVYFNFGTPISTAKYRRRPQGRQGSWEDEDVVNEVWERTRQAVEEGIELLRKVRLQDEHNSAVHRATLPQGQINAGKKRVEELVNLIQSEMESQKRGQPVGLASAV